ncbi:MAG TPA: capsular biosynthesis protein CpsI, partial [Geobacteraceae bacterium]|nr:capsular biosynthesis protein CpsI [Geobacteraceae bacterium]
VFNEGKMRRDFTYIDDIVEGVIQVMDLVPTPNPAWSGDDPDPGTSYAPYRLYNIGNNNPVELLRFIEVLEDKLGRKAIKRLLPMQAGDLPATCADIDDLARDAGFAPNTTIGEGIGRFVDWYRTYYRIKD